MNPPKIAFIGLGEHATRGHLKHLVKLNIHPEIGVFDPAFKRADAYRLGKGKTYKVFSTEAEAMHWADAVLICSPDRFHLAQMQAAIQHGCHVFCEKPLASAADDVTALDKLFKAAKRKDLTITSCHPRRFDPPYVALRDHLEYFVGDYGPLLEVRLDFSYHSPSKTGLHGGSLLQDHANHELDYFCWLTGLTKAADFTSIHTLVDDETRYHLVGVCTNGVVFNFSGTRCLDKSTYPESIFLRFERGELFLDTYKPANSYEMEHASRQKWPLDDFGKTNYRKRFGDMNRHWLNLIAGREENYLTPEQMKLNTAISVGQGIFDASNPPA